MTEKVPITGFNEGNCCPKCGRSKVILYTQFPLFVEFDMRGKQIIKDYRGKRVYKPSNKLLAAEYKSAISDWEWAFYRCTKCGWNSETYTQHP